MGRGAGSLILIAALFGALILNFLTACLVWKTPYLDVPYCTNVDSCLSYTGLSDLDYQYARAVAYAWYHANIFRKGLDALHDYCSMDVNFLEAGDALMASLGGTEAHLSLAMEFAGSSVEISDARLAEYVNELDRKGLPYVSDRFPELAEVYTTAVTYLKDSNADNDSPVTGYARARAEIMKKLSLPYSFLIKIISLTYFGFSPKTAVLAFSPVGTWMKRYPVILALYNFVSKSVTGAIELDKAINAAVGRRNSVYAAFKPVVEQYVSAMSAVNERAGEISSRSADLVKSISEGARRIKELHLDELGEMSAILSTGRVARAPIPEHPDEIAELSVALSENIYRSIRRDVTAYYLGDTNALVRLGNAEANMEELEDLNSEIWGVISSADDLIDRCETVLSRYRARSEYVRSLLPGVIRSLKETGSVYDCAYGLRLVSMDRNYSSDERMCNACASSISCSGEKFQCSLDPAGELARCMELKSKLSADIAASSAYEQYVEIKSAIQRLLAAHYDEAIATGFARLPDRFYCEKDLTDAIVRATEIYRALRSMVSQYATPEIRYEGYFSADSASSVDAVISLDAGAADLEVSMELPFKVVTYVPIESNGLYIRIENVKGKSVLFATGSGSARVRIVAEPVPLEMRSVGSSMGEMLYEVVNPLPLPVMMHYEGSVVSATGNVHWDANTIYFDGGGTAHVYVKAVSMEFVREGDKLSVLLRNKRGEKYSGAVIIPYHARSGPSYCTLTEAAAVCNVNLDPFEERVLEFTLDENQDAARVFSEIMGRMESTEENTVVFSGASPVPTSDVSSSLSKADEEVSKYLSGLRKSIDESIDLLEKYLHRASELNVTALLPYDDATLNQLSELADTNDSLVLRTVYTILSDYRNAVESRARYFVYALESSGDADEEEIRLARNALSSGDYVLALAIARPKFPFSKASGISWAAPALAVISLLLLTIYIGANRKKPRKKKRIPKI